MPRRRLVPARLSRCRPVRAAAAVLPLRASVQGLGTGLRERVHARLDGRLPGVEHARPRQRVLRTALDRAGPPQGFDLALGVAELREDRTRVLAERGYRIEARLESREIERRLQEIELARR